MDGWVTTWGCAVQPPDQSDDPALPGATVRQTIRISVGGRRSRLRLSNEYGRAPLPIDAVAVAQPLDGRAGSGAIEPGSSRLLSFGGSTAVRIPPGGTVTTDPFDLPIEPRTNIAVTMHLAAGVPIVPTTHPGSRTTSHVIQAEVGREPAELVAEPALVSAVAVAHWYLLASLEVQPYGRIGGPGELPADSAPQASPELPAGSAPQASPELPAGSAPQASPELPAGSAPQASPERAPAVAVLLGDSLTDGRGSTTDGNDRWPDQLLDRLHQRDGLAHVGFVNQAAGGNRLLRDGLGISALGRFDRDVLACAGVAWLVLFEGINDIGQAEATVPAQQRIGDELLAGYGEIVDRAHARGIRVYGATLTPFGGHEYDDPAGLREQTRRRVNGWIRGGGRFDAVIDFDRAVRSPRTPHRVRRMLHDGDGLHLNPDGYRALAGVVDADLFRR